MAVKIPIHERVSRELQARLAAALPGWLDDEIELELATAADKTAAVVERLDPRGNDVPLFSPVLIEGAATIEEGGDGDGGIVTYQAEYLVTIFLAIGETFAGLPQSVQQRWVARFEALLPTSGYLNETGTGEPLATVVRPTGHDTPVTVKGEYVAEAAFEVQFDTYRGNPYRGPGNTERTE